MSEPTKANYDEDIAIRGRMDIEDIVRLQINRCNASAYEPDQTLFESSVKVLLDLLPKHQRERVIDNKKKYQEKGFVVRYTKHWCGQPITSSKEEIEVTITDFHNLYRIVLDAFADSGLTWQIEPQLIEMRRKEGQISEPTPHFKEDLNVEK